MNCLLLSNNGIALNLPPSLGGSVANYNYMLKLDMIYKQAVVLPSNINNKEVVMLGEVWTTGNMSNIKLLQILCISHGTILTLV